MTTAIRTVFHRDGTVTVWDCITGAWRRRTRNVPDAVLSTLNANDRARIVRHLNSTTKEARP